MYWYSDLGIIVLILCITGYKGWKLYLAAKYGKSISQIEDDVDNLED